MSNAVQKGPEKLRDSKCPKANLKYFFGLKNIKPTLAFMAKASIASEDQILNIYLYFLIILYFSKILLLLNLTKLTLFDVIFLKYSISSVLPLLHKILNFKLQLKFYLFF